jgi:hypothetical protein
VEVARHVVSGNTGESGKQGRERHLKIRLRCFAYRYDNIDCVCRLCPYNHTSTAHLPYFTLVMPPKRKPATPSSRKRTPKKSRKAATSQCSRDVHYPGGGLQTTFAVEGKSSLII